MTPNIILTSLSISFFYFCCLCHVTCPHRNVVYSYTTHIKHWNCTAKLIQAVCSINRNRLHGPLSSYSRWMLHRWCLYILTTACICCVHKNTVLERYWYNREILIKQRDTDTTYSRDTDTREILILHSILILIDIDR